MIQPTNTLTLDGTVVEFKPGETLLALIRRQGNDMPTLCAEDRLDPTGACRMCLAKIEGWPRLAPTCATVCTPGMVVATEHEDVRRHQQVLTEMYLADHPDTEACPVDNRVHQYARQFEARSDRFEPLVSRRTGRKAEINPYIAFQPDLCIACANCTRYCDEVEGVNAITLINRGADVTIGTVDDKDLLDTTCELCGGCIDVCPTGAMTEKKPLDRGHDGIEAEKVRTTCNYCGVGCQFDINVDPDGRDGAGEILKVTSPPTGTTTNDGNLCVKGRFAYDFVHHPDRLTVPLVRGDDGELHEASWDEALSRIAEGLNGVRDRHGKDALGFVSSSRCTGEENYLMQKLSRAVFRTNNIHQCAAT